MFTIHYQLSIHALRFTLIEIVYVETIDARLETVTSRPSQALMRLLERQRIKVIAVNIANDSVRQQVLD
jgi:hypothetical protein